MRGRQGTVTTPWPLLLAGALMLGFLTAPLFALLHALPDADASVFGRPVTVDALRTSLIAAVAATLLDAVLGIPLAYYLAHTRSRARHLIMAAVIMPLALPPVVGGLALILVFGRASSFGGFLESHGRNPLDSIYGTILAQAFVAAPFVVVTARAAFARVPSHLDDAARALGDTPLRAFWRIHLPVARIGLAAGVVLGFLRCLGEFGATAVLAFHPYTLPTLTYLGVSGEGIPVAIPSAILVAAAGVTIGAAALFLDARQHTPLPDAAGDTMDDTGTLSDLDWVRPVGEGEPGLSIAARAHLGTFTLDSNVATTATVTGILGPSGSGKSLTMRAIAGLLPIIGTIRIGPTTLTDTARRINIPAHKRHVGYVAQQDALFEHLDVAANVSYGIRHLPAMERTRRVDELLASVGLSRLRRARPSRLSGGERQRVALARALAPGPRALLLDESFSNLDTAIRAQLRDLVRRLHERTGIPVVIVTHDREDVLEIADHCVVMAHGHVLQQGPIEDVFRHPTTTTAARLVGVQNIVPVRERPSRNGAGTLVVTDWGRLNLGPNCVASADHVGIPADAVGLAPTGTPATIEASRLAVDGRRRLRLRTPHSDDVLEALVDPDAEPPAAGDTVHVHIDGTRCHLLSPERTRQPGATPPRPSSACPHDREGLTFTIIR